MIRRSQPAVKNGHGRESLKICPTMSEPRLTLTLCPYIVNEWIFLRRRGLNLMLILADDKIYVIITIGLSVSAFFGEMVVVELPQFALKHIFLPTTHPNSQTDFGFTEA